MNRDHDGGKTIDGHHSFSFNLNGDEHQGEAEPRLLLSDYLRHHAGLTGTHVGCEHGVCGACTVLVDGEAVRSCLMLAVQADGHEVTTVEGLTPEEVPAATPAEGNGTAGNGAAGAGGVPPLHPLQDAFWEAHGLQCGFCTPGILMTLVPFLEENPDPSEEEIRYALSGNLCRCTGYQHIVDAVLLAAQRQREAGE